ncbi:MAG: DUF3783 domain-containing protein [Thermodesulfobacteriota bacterium]|nr:DUF3783 domain-containing protein [Thermodesulfobacteriota bacterium]
MKHKEQFTKVGKSNKRMYGPKGLLVCGYPEEAWNDFLNLVDQVGLSDTRVVFASSNDLEESVGDMLTDESKAGFAGASDMPRAVIMSGLTQNELHRLLTAYREAGFASQIWATLTPVSQNWPLGHLLNELQTENKAMKNKGKN